MIENDIARTYKLAKDILHLQKTNEDEEEEEVNKIKFRCSANLQKLWPKGKNTRYYELNFKLLGIATNN